ncbi:MAG: hypothetical protein C0483_23625 [Pirellula sp.]|nr:hypothetical protein [Pirellula sp.]
MAITLQSDGAGIVFGVKAQAGGRANAVRGEHDGCLKVSVTQAPEKGKANQAIAAVLCEAIGLRRSQLVLVAGETDPRKKFRATEISAAELAARFDRLLTTLRSESPKS